MDRGVKVGRSDSDASADSAEGSVAVGEGVLAGPKQPLTSKARMASTSRKQTNLRLIEVLQINTRDALRALPEHLVTLRQCRRSQAGA